MSRPTRYLETKNCNRCKSNKNFNDFRIEDIGKVFNFYKKLIKTKT